LLTSSIYEKIKALCYVILFYNNFIRRKAEKRKRYMDVRKSSQIRLNQTLLMHISSVLNSPLPPPHAGVQPGGKGVEAGRVQGLANA